jgi:transposase-like protein
MIAEARSRYALPVRALAAEMGLGASTLGRWRRRLSRGQAAVGRRGPCKVKPLNLSDLRERIDDLEHSGRRSRGSGALHRVFGSAVSRREIDRMVREARIEATRDRRAEIRHVSWLRSNLAWAMDDCQTPDGVGAEKLYLHNLTDLGSRYRLPPLAAAYLPCGEEVAGHLQQLFDRFEPPLFCKRDNGGNLNHQAVNQVLEEALVIPINSPPRMAPYNGAVEHTQGEFKGYLDRWGWKAAGTGSQALLAESAAHDLNHQPRRCLGGGTACRAYFGGTRIRYSRRKRAAVYLWVRELAAEVSVRAGESVITPASWRIAARQWLVTNKLIKIERSEKVSPHFGPKSAHN